MEICRVLKQRKDGIKMVVVPKNSDIESGDYVKIIKIKEAKNDREKN